MILANISTPLLGFVDTAVIGHLSDSHYLAGVALGSLVISVMMWLLGFLRMSTTGVVAQGIGKRDGVLIKRTVYQGLALGIVLSCIILLLQHSIFSLLLSLVNQGDELTEALRWARVYFDIRIWTTPLVLANLVFTGFLIAKGRTKLILYTVILCNLINLFADIVLVMWFEMGVAGVAYAAVLAELSLFLLLSYFVISVLRALPVSGSMFTDVKALLSLNRDLFLRSVFLQLCLSFMTIYATRYGTTAVAVNAILMQFFLFISFVLDGVAYSIESLLGAAVGRQQKWKQKLIIASGSQLGLLSALAYTLFYVLSAGLIINLLTNLTELTQALNDYIYWIYLMPLVSFASFIFDGVFIGLTMIKQMRNSMFMAMAMFFVVFITTRPMENHGLWFTFSCFMLTRGASQWFMLKAAKHI